MFFQHDETVFWTISATMVWIVNMADSENAGQKKKKKKKKRDGGRLKRTWDVREGLLVPVNFDGNNY